MSISLPPREGRRPRVYPEPPHSQLDQTPSQQMHERLAERLFALEAIVERPSMVSVPGARALVVAPGASQGPRDAFMVGAEFAHVHPPHDGSLHVAVRPEDVEEVLEKGWGEPHPMAMRGYIPGNVLMIYAPRDEQELEVVMHIVEASRARALGQG
jgi:hypothetical protein